MRTTHVLYALLVFSMLVAQGDEPLEKQPWQSAYAGEDVTGPDVMGVWKFDLEAPDVDASGKGHKVSLRGRTRYAEDGKFGACIECFSSGRGNDVVEGVATVYRPEGMTPAGPFTLELWIKPKPELMEKKQAFLIDKKLYHYHKDLPKANHDYCLYTSRRGKDQRTFTAFLGFGKDSAGFTSKAVTLESDQWCHVAFTYDGKGTGAFFLNSVSIGGGMHPGRGAVSPGRYPLVIGDRAGSVHSGFPGYIDEVRISSQVVPFFSGQVLLEIGGRGSRTVFRRMEPGRSVAIQITNDTATALTGVRAAVAFGGVNRVYELADAAPRGIVSLELPVDTAVRPDRYPLQVVVTARAGEREYRVEQSQDVVITPRPLPLRMPVVMWGAGTVDQVEEVGFSHRTSWMGHFDHLVWNEGAPTTAIDATRLRDIRRMLDEHLAADIGVLPHVYPGRHMIRKKRLPQEDRDGKPYDRTGPCCARPEALAFGYNVGVSVAMAMGDHPAWAGALLDSETRGHTHPCFCEHCKAAYREHSGKEIPAEVKTGSGVRCSTLQTFPRDRVVPDNHPILEYYRWFWSRGDGWNDFHTRTDRGLKSRGRTDIWTFYDPAVRVPSIWGSGGDVDALSQWTYVYPDPLNIGQSTDELFAMADGRPGQEVMKMTQIIWYRNRTAPHLPKDEADRAQWEKDIPDARFITIPPTHLREALWFELARPVRGVMYHGWGSLVPSTKGSYRYTNPETRHALSNLIRTVVRPLGPTLLQVPDRVADVALLESFTSQVFSGGTRATRGWGQGWVADAHLVLQWADLQPRIVYEETVLRHGLAGYRVLVMPGCDVLTDSVAKAVHAFQARGGIVVADEHLTPGVIPDILLRSYRRTKKAREDKAALQALAAQLQAELDPFYQRYGDADDPDLVIRFRRYRDCDYLFAVNDKRTFGTYVGHHGMVMEEGLPNAATLTLQRPAGYVYDLTAHRAVDAVVETGRISLRAEFGPGQGRLFLVCPQQIAGVTIDAAKGAALGRKVELTVTIKDTAGAPVAAVLPLRVEVLDPQGRLAEFSGYYGAKDGRVSLALDVARNDLPGVWTVRATELAAGKQAEAAFAVAQRAE